MPAVSGPTVSFDDPAFWQTATGKYASHGICGLLFLILGLVPKGCGKSVSEQMLEVEHRIVKEKLGEFESKNTSLQAQVNEAQAKLNVANATKESMENKTKFQAMDFAEKLAIEQGKRKIFEDRFTILREDFDQRVTAMKAAKETYEALAAAIKKKD